MRRPRFRSTERSRTSLAVGALGTLLGSLVILSLLASIDWDASALLRVGEDDPAIVGYVEERLDHVRPVAPLGHDGKYYFIQAHDPWLIRPEQNASIIDRPVYRTQRMLYPLLAGGGGFLEGWAVVWGLIVVNLFAIALGTWATSKLAVALGTSPWWGLAFALNPGVIFELIIDGAGAVGWALGVLGVWLMVEGRYRGAVLALMGGVLAREAMILVAIGLGVQLWRTSRAKAIGVIAWPAAVAVLWAVWVRVRMGVPLLTSESEEIGIPFVGLAEAAREWIVDPGRNLAFGLVVFILLLVVTMQAIRRPSLVSFSTLGFVLLASLLTRQVWLNYFDISRAVAPVFTTFVLVMFSGASQPADEGRPMGGATA